jgi:hypothetical protein
VEAVEAGALDDGGAGSSHGRLRSSRRTAFPRAASNSSFSPHFSSSSGVRVCGQGSGSPEAARVGRVQGLRRRLLIAACSAGYVDDRHALEGRGARRDCGHDRCGRALALAISQSGKEEGDDGDVSMTPS